MDDKIIKTIKIVEGLKEEIKNYWNALTTYNALSTLLDYVKQIEQEIKDRQDTEQSMSQAMLEDGIEIDRLKAELKKLEKCPHGKVTLREYCRACSIDYIEKEYNHQEETEHSQHFTAMQKQKILDLEEVRDLSKKEIKTLHAEIQYLTQDRSKIVCDKLDLEDKIEAYKKTVERLQSIIKRNK